MREATKHRLKYHQPRLLGTDDFLLLQWLLYGKKRTIEGYRSIKPRCTFAEMGKDCPIVKELEK